MIDYQAIQDLIASELQVIIANDSDSYGDVKLYISNEQQYVKQKDREKGAIYIVLKFLQASVNFGQVVLPITIDVVSERNKMDVAQKLLIEFAQTYNLTMNSDNTIKQVYTAPMVTSNFNEVFNGFRSVLVASATYLISDNINTATISYNDTTLDLITAGISFVTQPDTQPYASEGNFTKSVNQFGTFTLAIVTYLTDNPLLNQFLQIMCKTKDMNTTFDLTITWKTGLSVTSTFKMVAIDIQQDVGNLPIANVTLTN